MALTQAQREILLDSHTASEVILGLKLAETSELGSGCYGSVFDVGNERVWKVGRRGGEDGALSYLLWLYESKAWTRNSAFPCVYNIWTRTRLNGEIEFYVAEMERLAAPTWVAEKTSQQFDAAERGLRGEEFPGKYATNSRARVAYEATYLLASVFGHNMTRDLHNGNVMMRGDQLVITDPYGACSMQPVVKLLISAATGGDNA